jgi:chromosome segregation ATPase
MDYIEVGNICNIYWFITKERRKVLQNLFLEYLTLRSDIERTKMEIHFLKEDIMALKEAETDRDTYQASLFEEKEKNRLLKESLENANLQTRAEISAKLALKEDIQNSVNQLQEIINVY